MNLESEKGKLERVQLANVAVLNPGVAAELLSRPEQMVSFVPMSAVSEDSASVIASEEREARHCLKGYTPFERGDVLVAKITPCFENGKIVLANIPHRYGFGSTEFHVIRADSSKLDARYLLHVLRHPEFRLKGRQRMTGSAGQRRVPENFLSTFAIPLPPLSEQRRIAAILDKADELRAKRRAALKKLDELTQSIFLDMFGDPATNPKGWPVRRLDAMCDLENGRAFKPEEWEDEGLPIIRIQNLNDATKPFNYTTKSLPERFRVRPGDILFSWSGTPGTSFGCFRWSGPEGWLNQHIFKVRLNGTLEGDYFITHVNLKLGELIAKAHGGVGLQHVTKGMIDETLLMIPPAQLQLDFSHRVATARKLATTQAASLTRFDAVFASLQHRAFRGEL